MTSVVDRLLRDGDLHLMIPGLSVSLQWDIGIFLYRPTGFSGRYIDVGFRKGYRYPPDGECLLMQDPIYAWPTDRLLVSALVWLPRMRRPYSSRRTDSRVLPSKDTLWRTGNRPGKNAVGCADDRE